VLPCSGLRSSGLRETEPDSQPVQVTERDAPIVLQPADNDPWVHAASRARARTWGSRPSAWDALSDPGLLDPAARTGANLRATVRGVSSYRDDLDIVWNAPQPPSKRVAYLQLWRRGAEEIRAWLTGGARPLAQQTATAWRNP
jgi:hypothetical protein